MPAAPPQPGRTTSTTTTTADDRWAEARGSHRYARDLLAEHSRRVMEAAPVESGCSTRGIQPPTTPNQQPAGMRGVRPGSASLPSTFRPLLGEFNPRPVEGTPGT